MPGARPGVWCVSTAAIARCVTISPNVSRDGDYRTAVNPPLAFSPQDPHTLAEGTQFLLATSDAGHALEEDQS